MQTLLLWVQQRRQHNKNDRAFFWGCSAKLLRQPFAPPRAKAEGSAEKGRRAGAVEEAGRKQAPATGLFEKFMCRA